MFGFGKKKEVESKDGFTKMGIGTIEIKSIIDESENNPEYQEYLQKKEAEEAHKEAAEKEVVMKHLKNKFKVGTEIYREDDDEANKLEEGFVIQILDFHECQYNPFKKPELNLKVLVKTTEGFFKENTSHLIIKETAKSTTGIGKNK